MHSGLAPELYGLAFRDRLFLDYGDIPVVDDIRTYGAQAQGTGRTFLSNCWAETLLNRHSMLIHLSGDRTSGVKCDVIEVSGKMIYRIRSAGRSCI